jgi:hypothetical protein
VSLQLKAVVLYNYQGDSRWLPFRLGKLNVITGLSKRGKSGIIDIVDYCMGRSTYTVFEGVNRGVVSWYAIVLTDGKNDVFIAKPEPVIGAKSQSGAYFKVGQFSSAPPFEWLVLTVNDTYVREELSKLLGFQSDFAFFSNSSSKSDFEVSIKHSKFFIFQEQGEIANKRALFHRQAEEGVAAGIRDSLPVILGATRADHLALLEELRAKRRQLSLIDKDLFERKSMEEGPSVRASQLVAQLVDAGVLDSAASDKEDLREVLKFALNWRPSETVIPQEDALGQTRSELRRFREILNEEIEERSRVREYLENFSGYTDELGTQRRRLEPVGLLSHEESISCPLCGAFSEEVTEDVSNAKSILYKLRDELSQIELERPKLENYLLNIKQKINGLRVNIRSQEQKLMAMLEERQSSLNQRDRELAASRVVGKAALYIETTDTDSGKLEGIRQKRNTLAKEIEKIEQKVDLDAIRSRTDAILGNINLQLRKYAEVFHHEYSRHPFKLDIKELTITVQTLDQELPMLRQGSGENYLACHLAAFLALHDYFIEADRPVPRFMILDQPSQVHFPRQDQFYDVTQSGTRELATDPEIDAVKRDLKGLHDACEGHKGRLQIIVLEHANFPDLFFQEALVEPPWIGKGGLVPEAWLK